MVFGIVSAIVAFFYIWCYSRCKLRDCLEGRGEDYLFLKLRLQRFAELLGLVEFERDARICDAGSPIGVLTSSQHKILLGILKKIEAKNTVLVATTALSLAIMGQYYFNSYLVNPVCQLHGWGLFVAIGLLAGTIGARIDGASHVDQFDFVLIEKKFSCPQDQLTMLQQSLMRDLILKEARFRASIHILSVVVISGLLAVIFSNDVACGVAGEYAGYSFAVPVPPHNAP